MKGFCNFVTNFKYDSIMGNKIQELTDKIYQEGVEKGNVEAKQLVDNAQKEASEILEKARKDADAILATARKESDELSDHTRSELKMYASQSVNALKSEITDLITNKVVADAVSAQTANSDFLNNFMLEIARSWSVNEPIIIESANAKALTDFFAAKAKGLLDKGVSIEEVNGQKAFFTIKPVDGTYKVEFGEEEIENYFKAYLRPQLITMLFN